jgi:hypothetical protein
LLAGQPSVYTHSRPICSAPADKTITSVFTPLGLAFTIADSIGFHIGGGGMKRRETLSSIAAAVLLAALCSAINALPAAAQAPPEASAVVPKAGSFLLTVFLRHDQTKTVEQINEHLKQTGWYDKFPPDGVEIVAWYVMMGIGQVVILRVPAEKLRDTNRVIEQTAWGGYRTEFYPTYDFKPVWDAIPHHRP